MKKKSRIVKIRVKSSGKTPPREQKKIRVVCTDKLDGACENAEGAAGKVSLRLLAKPDHAGQNMPVPSVDRSRLILVLNEKMALLADLTSCTEELVELYKAEGRTDKQIKEMEDLCGYYAVQYGESHHRTMDILHNTAKLHAMQGEFSEAKQILDKLYPLRVAVSGRKDEKSLKCYALRAVVFEELGQHIRAMQSLTELSAFGSDVLPELVCVAREECEEIYKSRQKKKNNL